MKKIIIDNNLVKELGYFNVIPYVMETPNILISKKVSDLFDLVINELQSKYTIEDVVSIPKIKESRDGYKKLHIDPSRYRLACESLIRRIVKGLGVYKINDIVDLGNILSIKTMRSVCVVDLDKVVGDVFITKGKDTDLYEGINRGTINITNMPCYKDDESPFGTPTSDTYRTCVTKETKNILVMIICFSDNDLENDEKQLIDLYKNYGKCINLTKLEIVK